MATAEEPPGSRGARLRASNLTYRMTRAVDPTEVERTPGAQSWHVTVTEPGTDTPYARLDVHRLPLHRGEDLVLETDWSGDVPASTVVHVIDGDDLIREVALMVDPEGDRTRDVPENVLILELPELDTEWNGSGAGELLCAEVLAELQDCDDVAVAAAAAPWTLKGTARAEALALHVPALQNLGFTHLEEDVWLLTDWAALHQAHGRYRCLFGFPVLPWHH